jgi:HAD superfamily hydrolase (TIGR01549 family)
MFKMIKAYFFDWMSTLASVDNEKGLRDTITQKEHEALLTKKFNEVGIGKERRDLIGFELSIAQLNLYPDSESVINNLKANYQLAIISNIYEMTSQRIKKLFPSFLKKFDFITWSCEVGVRKPNQAIFKYTLNKLNLFPNEVIMIGDSYDKDVAPALNLGMQAKLINRTKQNLDDVVF